MVNSKGHLKTPEVVLKISPETSKTLLWMKKYYAGCQPFSPSFPQVPLFSDGGAPATWIGNSLNFAN